MYIAQHINKGHILNQGKKKQEKSTGLLTR